MAWLGAAISIGGALFGNAGAKKDKAYEKNLTSGAIDAADPYAKYRHGDADTLHKFMTDPSSIEDSALWKARMKGAERVMAAQGYTGSGNALVAAADAGASVYQQQFDNLAKLSGADAVPGQGYGWALDSDRQKTANSTSQSAIGNIAGSVFNAFAGG